MEYLIEVKDIVGGHSYTCNYYGPLSLCTHIYNRYKSVAKVVERQGWYKELTLDDEGVIISETTVTKLEEI